MRMPGCPMSHAKRSGGIRMARLRACAVVFALFITVPCMARAEKASTSGTTQLAAADDEPVDPDYAKDEKDLEDIESLVVTARRRPEFLQETPVAATVLGGELLEQRGIDSVEDIGVYVPNLTSFS